MPRLRPVTEYLVRNTNGTIHIVKMRDFGGKYERTMCGNTSEQFDSKTAIGLSDMDQNHPDLCQRCANIYYE